MCLWIHSTQFIATPILEGLQLTGLQNEHRRLLSLKTTPTAMCLCVSLLLLCLQHMVASSPATLCLADINKSVSLLQNVDCRRVVYPSACMFQSLAKKARQMVIQKVNGI